MNEQSTARRLSDRTGREQLSAFASYMAEQHLEALAELNLRLNRQLDVPLLRLFEHMPEDELLQLGREGLVTFLTNLAEGRALHAAAESLRRWEADELPGIPKGSIQASDLVLIYVAQEQALLSFLGRYTQDVDEALVIGRELRIYYAAAQDEAFKVFSTLRDQAVERAVRAEAAHQAAESAAEEFQALNEELASQQEELGQLYEQLQRQHEAVEAEVASRTEELQAANEELAAQSEELLSQQDELLGANRELAHQRSLLSSVLNNVPGSIGYCDRDMIVRTVNKRYAEDAGKTAADMLNRHASEALPGMTPEFLEMLEGLMASGEPMVGFGQPANRLVDGQVTEVYQDFSVIPVYDADGNPEGLLSLSVDVTERVRLEREIARQGTLLERIISQAPAGIAYLDTDLVVRRVNPAFMTMFNQPAEFYLDRHFLESAPAEARQAFEPVLRGILATGEPHYATSVPYVVARDGMPAHTHWDFSYVPSFNDAGDVEGMLVFAQEVSARVAQEQRQQGEIDQVRQLDTMKDEFLSAMSYQLSTPINTILGFATVLEEGAVGGDLKPEQRDYLRRIIATTHVQLALVNDLLDLSRLSGGKFSLARYPLDVVGATHRILQTLSPIIEQQAQRLVVYLPDDMPKVNADEQRVEQVVTNMLHTAIKMSPPGGMVRVEVKHADGQLVVDIQDSGRPLDPEQTAAALERFTQLGGTWLGFSITKQLVEAHGGRLGIRSEAGIGNAYWFSLPTA
ncbi:MAG: PAS domain-containing protein [Candidatus Sericytochromatia bacterium]